MTSDTPIAVPPDKAPLRRQGDLLATLALLQETYSKLWTRIGEGHWPNTEQLAIISGLIATAVQQAEALPKPEGDLAAWQEEAIKCRDRLYTLAYGDGPDDFVAVERNEVEGAGNLLTAMIGHLAAMPAAQQPAGDLAAWQKKAEHILSAPPRRGSNRLVAIRRHLAAMPAPPDVNTGLLGALQACLLVFTRLGLGLSTMPEVKLANAAIAAAEKGAPEQAASRRPCKCGGLPAEHRYRMGDGAWCECMDTCTCDGYEAAEEAAS